MGVAVKMHHFGGSRKVLTLSRAHLLSMIMLNIFSLHHLPYHLLRCDQHAHSEVTQKDLRNFEKTWKIPVLKVKNIPDSSQSDTNDTINTMNIICEQLWQRDLILAGKISNPAGLQSPDTVKHYTSDEYI